MKHVFMLSKNELKYIQSLYHKKQRDEERLFIAEGPKLAEELINSALTIKKVYALPGWLEKNASLKVPFAEISEIELSRISALQTPNEVVVIVEQPVMPQEPQLKSQLTLVLDGIQDPGNMGTIIRIADWFGINQLVCSNDCVEMYNPKVVQSSMGSILRINSWYKAFAAWLFPTDIPVFGALLHGTNVYSVGRVQEGLLVIGNESRGIREPLLSKITHPITIPKAGGAESLNAAVATGIIAGCFVNNS
jgi:TrmH family RNA methyltransferase